MAVMFTSKAAEKIAATVAKVHGARSDLAPGGRPFVDRTRPGGVPTGALFAVKVWASGGSWGGPTTACSITYNVRSIDATSPTTGTSLGTNMTPKKLRPALGKLAGASSTGEGTVGCGYYDAANVFCLYDANETLFTEAC